MSPRSALLALGLLCAAPPAAAEAPWYVAPPRRDAQEQLERALASVPSARSLHDSHDLLAGTPHVTGTPGDLQLTATLAAVYERLGLEVERQELLLYVPRPVSAEVEVLSPVRRRLPLAEPALAEDPYTAHPDLDPGWSAWSGSGEATGAVVYANYGRREDFQRLEELGVRVDGRVVLARYGGAFRGYPVRYAEEAGAAAVLLYSDPADSGYGRGIPYPEGGWRNGDSVERGAVLTLPWVGDPLTPGEPATAAAERLDPATLDLPAIPVQPLGWDAAAEILGRMRGPAVPEGWQGGLPFAYRLTGGDELRVRVRVEQHRGLVRTHNVIARLAGARFPEQTVILGCHHDAWGFGASDPAAGGIVLLEVARAFAESSRRGARPDRTLIFAHWAAEEAGILGSTEWVEGRLDELQQSAVAYLNLDMAAMGSELRVAASPTLKALIADVAKRVPHPLHEETSVYERWAGVAGPETRPPFGRLGGGSDHVAFYAHAGIPAAGIGAGGAPGTAYHTAYDTLAWYRQVVGDDYAGALMLSRLVAKVAVRLANADVLPLDPVAYAVDAREYLGELAGLAREAEVEVDLGPLYDAIDGFEALAAPVMAALREAVAQRVLAAEGLAGVNWELLQLERLWLQPQGLPERPWYRNQFAAPDPTSGYVAWMLPALRYGIEAGDGRLSDNARDRYVRIFRLLGERFRLLGRLLLPPAAGDEDEREAAESDELESENLEAPPVAPGGHHAAGLRVRGGMRR
ncbi:MAG TPA: M28 family peptidase [Thermoanaerobaculia bacterium]|nr:M28 family peptidase [Thermoanaerobaculia bacterium]